PTLAEAEALLATAPEPSRLILDVRYPDGAPFEGELRVEWNPTPLQKTLESDTAKPEVPGRYPLDVLAGDLTLAVSDRNGSGSFPPWRGQVTCYPGQPSTAFVTLPRGASPPRRLARRVVGDRVVQTPRRRGVAGEPHVEHGGHGHDLRRPPPGRVEVRAAAGVVGGAGSGGEDGGCRGG
ncbi:MAG: hypothetical protein ACYTFV_01105, partial [Planctomycetota bacterium]